MEGLRGFAVFLVFIVHYATLVQPWIASEPLRALSAAMHAIGNTGVDLFFVLSGYLIYGSLMARPQGFSAFMARRLRRIYPAFAVVFVIYVALSLVVPGESRIPASAGAALVYLSANFLLLPGLFPIEPLITVAWSLSYEMFYYLSLPLLITALRLRQRSARWRVGFFGAVALVGLLLGATVGGPVRLLMFVSGILLHEAHEVQESRRASLLSDSLSSAVGALALAAGLLAMLLPVSGPAGFATKIAVLFVAFFLLCLACFRPATLPLPRAFSWRPLRWLGNMSYSYYLLHGLALKAAFVALGALVTHDTGHDAVLFWGLLPIMFAVTLIPTAALFLAVERPLSLKPTARR
jgi:peptidoglycan/LPS O-acetylase OafA/YrhL